MTAQLVMAFDPGLITGMALGGFTSDTALELIDTRAVTYAEILEMVDDRAEYRSTVQHVPVEEFILRDNPFRADLTGVRVEGILECVFGDKVSYRPPSMKSQVPDQVLKDHDLWQTGTDVDWEDGRDANDAIIHLLGYVAFDLKHVPTLRKYFR